MLNKRLTLNRHQNLKVVANIDVAINSSHRLLVGISLTDRIDIGYISYSLYRTGYRQALVIGYLT